MPERTDSQEQLPLEAILCRLNRHAFPDEQDLPYEVYRDALNGEALRKSAYCDRKCRTKKVWEFVEHIRDGYEVVDRVGSSLDYSETVGYLLANGNGRADLGRLRYIATREQLKGLHTPPTPKKAPKKATADPFVVEPVEPARKRTPRKATKIR